MLTCLNIGLSGCLKQSCVGGKPPQRPKSNKNAALFKLFHDTNVDVVSDRFCLIVSVLSLSRLFREIKRGGSAMLLEVINFPVLPYLSLCPSGPGLLLVWSVHLCQSANSYWSVADSGSKRSETLTAI